MEQYDIFISYSTKDSVIAEDLKERLRHKGLTCFLAGADIKISDYWKNRIHAAMRYSKLALFLITENASENDWVKFEAGAAWALKKKILPLLVDGGQLFDIFKDIQFRKISSNDLDVIVDELSAINDFNQFWNAFLIEKKPEDDVYAVLSSKIGVDYAMGKATGEKGHTVLVSFNEFRAALGLQKKLDKLREQLQVVHGGVKTGSDSGDIELPDFPQDGNLIIFGSIHANQICLKVMEHERLKPLPYQFVMLKEGKKSRKYIKCGDDLFPGRETKSEKKDSKIETDYGILLRATNPLDEKKENKVLIIAGNHGHGTEAAIKFVTDPIYIKQLRKEVNDEDFEALFEVEFEGNELKKLELLRIKSFEDGKWVREIRLRD